jgi:hypothetical protein
MTGSGERWWSETESPKAWMSVRDADLYEGLLHRLAAGISGRPLTIVEWGAGRSTLWYTQFLDTLGVPYRWLALEHDGAFIEQQVAPLVAARRDMAIASVGPSLAGHLDRFCARPGTLIVAFQAGELRPFLPGRESDRAADLDDYVGLPASLGISFDLAVVDGRKRRRCTLEGARLVGERGYVLLHDAWRRHYQCAFAAFASGRRFGDEWWIGSQRTTDFTELLPGHAFARHIEDPPG